MRSFGAFADVPFDDDDAALRRARSCDERVDIAIRFGSIRLRLRFDRHREWDRSIDRSIDRSSVRRTTSSDRRSMSMRFAIKFASACFPERAFDARSIASGRRARVTTRAMTPNASFVRSFIHSLTRIDRSMDSIQYKSIQYNSIQFNSIDVDRFDRDSYRLDSTRLDSRCVDRQRTRPIAIRDRTRRECERTR